MPQLLRTTQLLPVETVSWEAFLGLGGTGAKTFDTVQDLSANVVLYDTAANKADEYLTEPDGTRIEIAMTLYVQGDVASVPVQGDRVTHGGISYIVAQRKTVQGLFYTSSEPDHHRLRCRLE